jgi:hypothetical protein
LVSDCTEWERKYRLGKVHLIRSLPLLSAPHQTIMKTVELGFGNRKEKVRILRKVQSTR